MKENNTERGVSSAAPAAATRRADLNELQVQGRKLISQKHVERGCSIRCKSGLIWSTSETIKRGWGAQFVHSVAVKHRFNRAALTASTRI